MFKPNWYEDILKEDKEKQEAKPILDEFIKELQLGYAKYKEIKGGRFHEFIKECLDYTKTTDGFGEIKYKGEQIRFTRGESFGLAFTFKLKGNEIMLCSWYGTVE